MTEKTEREPAHMWQYRITYYKKYGLGRGKVLVSNDARHSTTDNNTVNDRE